MLTPEEVIVKAGGQKNNTRVTSKIQISISRLMERFVEMIGYIYFIVPKTAALQ